MKFNKTDSKQSCFREFQKVASLHYRGQQRIRNFVLNGVGLEGTVNVTFNTVKSSKRSAATPLQAGKKRSMFNSSDLPDKINESKSTGAPSCKKEQM